MCQNCNLSICYGVRQFLNFVIPGPTTHPGASWPLPLVCDIIKRSRKRIKTSKFQLCRVTAVNGKTSNGAPLFISTYSFMKDHPKQQKSAKNMFTQFFFSKLALTGQFKIIIFLRFLPGVTRSYLV
jgi:hypothetical protein